MSVSAGIYSKSNVVAAALCLGMAAPLPAQAEGTPMTAGVVMEKMDASQRGGYVIGLIEGFAYARFRKDSTEAGSKVETGMKCIYDFLYADTKAGIARIEAAFRKYPQHLPVTLLAALLKKECGE